MSKKGLIFDIQRFSIHDGSGIRTIVFMKGCPLDCRWCCNPESKSIYPEIAFYPHKCINCKRCINMCPKNAIIENNGERVIKREICKTCTTRTCIDVCNFEALKLIGQYVTVDEIMVELKKDEVFYQNSEGGGITISGGEPLYQADFVSTLLKKCKERGYNTAIETSSYCKWYEFEKVIKYVDLFLCDIKHMDEKLHIKGTGVSNLLILGNIKKLRKRGKKIIIRVPIIPGFNDEERNIKQICLLTKNNGIEEINLLPYHRLGESKYKNIGKKCYKLHNLKVPEKQKMKVLKKIVESYELVCRIGG